MLLLRRRLKSEISRIILRRRFAGDIKLAAIRMKLMCIFFTIQKTTNNFFLTFYTKGGRTLATVSAGMGGFSGGEKFSVLAGEVAGKLVLDKLLKTSFAKKLPALLKKLRKVGFRKSKFLRYRVHTFFSLLGRKMYLPSALLLLRRRRAKRVHTLLKLSFLRLNYFRLFKRKQKLKFKQMLYSRSFKRVTNKRSLKRFERNIKYLSKRKAVRLRKYLSFLKKFLFLRKSSVKAAFRLKKKQDWMLDQFNYHFVVRKKRAFFLSLYRRRLFRKRRHLKKRIKRLFKPFRLHLNKKYRYLFLKRLLFRFRFKLRKRLSRIRKKQQQRIFEVKKENRVRVKRYKAELSKLRNDHIRAQRRLISEAKLAGKFHKWVAFKKPKRLRLNRLKVPRKMPFLKKSLYKASRSLHFLKKARYKSLAKFGPIFIFVARTRPNVFLKASLRQVFRSVPVFCRFVSAARRPHNGIRKKKVRRM